MIGNLYAVGGLWTKMNKILTKAHIEQVSALALVLACSDVAFTALRCSRLRDCCEMSAWTTMAAENGPNTDIRDRRPFWLLCLCAVGYVGLPAFLPPPLSLLLLPPAPLPPLPSPSTTLSPPLRSLHFA